MNIFTTDKPIELSDHMLSTYRTLRLTLVAVALLLPWVLWLGGYYFSNGQLGLQSSMSAYYHTVMRNGFVGVLFAISGLLAAYKGYRPAENVALNFAAVFAVLIAVFPSEAGSRWHGIFAVSFFLCIAYVCIFCASATLSLVSEGKQKRYRVIYKLLGMAMVVSPAIAAILSEVLRLRSSYIFIAEAAGVYAFAAYWGVKTREIRETDADRKAAKGELQLEAGAGAADAVQELQVEPAV
jgi:hypothetical protein